MWGSSLIDRLGEEAGHRVTVGQPPIGEDEWEGRTETLRPLVPPWRPGQGAHWGLLQITYYRPPPPSLPLPPKWLLIVISHEFLSC